MKGNGRQPKGTGGPRLSQPTPKPPPLPQPVVPAPRVNINRRQTSLTNPSIPPVIRVSPITAGNHELDPQFSSSQRETRSCMTSATAATKCDDRRKLDNGSKKGFTTSIISSDLSPTMGYHLSRQSFSTPSSPNFLQQSQKPFDFDRTTSTTCQRVTNQIGQRPISASRFGRCHTIDSVANTTNVTRLLQTKLNSSELLSRSLSPPRFPHGQSPRPSTGIQARSKSTANISSDLLRPHAVGLKPKDYQSCIYLSPTTGRGNNGRKKQFTKIGTKFRKCGSPTSRFFPVLESTSECQQAETSNTTSRNLSERWQIKSETGFQQIRGTGIGTKMNFSKGRDESSSPSSSRSGRNSDECYRMVELRRNIMEVADSDTGRGSVDSDNSISSANLRRISTDAISTPSQASLRARMSLLGKSLSIDSNSDNPIPCKDFGIRDYLTMTGESIDNEEESSLAGDFGTGLGVIPPRFSIDSIDSQMAILQELKESRNSFSTSSSTVTSSAPFKETYRRFSEDIGILSSAAQRKNQSHAPLSPSSIQTSDMDARNHGDPNLDRIEEDCTKDSSRQYSEGRPQLHKSISIPYPTNVINRSPLPKIQEDRCAVVGSQVLLRDAAVDVKSCERECERLQADDKDDRKTSGDALMRTWKIEGTLDEFDGDDQCWQMDDDDLSTSTAENDKE